MLFTTVDRPDNKQFREFYTSAAALDAAKKGEPLPDGTVITMLQYAAKLDAQGNPEKDANGRFIKGNLLGYAVMEKRTGWGAEYPDNVRNGEWEYQAFKADKTPEHRGQSHRLLQLPQAARQAGFRLSLRQAQGRREIGPAHLIRPEGAENGPLFAQNAGKARRAVPFGREAVTFSCGYRAGGFAPPRGRATGVSNMAFLNTRDSADLEDSVETAVEGEIREFVRRDVATSLRRQPESDSEMVANNITSLLQRVAGTSVQEIDKLISELQTLRDMLQNEGARVQREIVEYATLSQAALQSTKIIAESLTGWKKVPDAPSLRD